MDYSKALATLVVVTYYDNDDCEEKTDRCLIYAENMQDVANFVTEWYGNDVTQVNTVFIGDSVVHLTDETVDKLMRRDNWDLLI